MKFTLLRVMFALTSIRLTRTLSDFVSDEVLLRELV